MISTEKLNNAADGGLLHPRLVRLIQSWPYKVFMAALNVTSTMMFLTAAARDRATWIMCLLAGIITALSAGIYVGAALRKFHESNAAAQASPPTMNPTDK